LENREIPILQKLPPFGGRSNLRLERSKQFTLQFPKTCQWQVGMEFMIQSPSPDWIIRNPPPCPLCLWGERERFVFCRHAGIRMTLTDRPTQARVEDELILCCSRTQGDEETSGRIRRLLKNEIDWVYLKERGRWHGVMPLLYLNVNRACDGEVSRDLCQRLKEHYLSSSRRNLALTGELVRLLRLFEVHGIPSISYKGPALAATAYRDLTLRAFDDLDILVHKADVMKAKEVLVSQGYEPLIPLSRVQEKAFLESPFEYSHHFGRVDGLGFVDLHWTVEPEYLTFAPSTGELWERLGRVDLGGIGIETLSAEDMLLFLCIHGTKHRWERLIWLCDLAAFIKTCGEVDWQAVMDRVESLGIKRMVSLSLLLARDLLGTDLPPEVQHRVMEDAGIRSLKAQVYQNLFREIQAQSWPFESGLFYLRAMDRLKDKSLYCFNAFVKPSRLEMRDLPLPSFFFPLYYLIRPIRLAGKYGLKLAKGLHRRNRMN
jgi:hypothetical protein